MRARALATRTDMAVEPDKNAAIRRQVALGTAANYAGRIINLGVWFVLTPIILSQLGKTNYGLWALVGSFVAYGSLADLGIAAAVTKYVAEYRARGDNETASAADRNRAVALLRARRRCVVGGRGRCSRRSSPT